MNEVYHPSAHAVSLPYQHAELTQQIHIQLLLAFGAGLLLPLGFAPFHLPGFVMIGLACLFLLLNHISPKRAFILGASFGLGFFGLGISWIYNSIHAYGHLNWLLSACLTFLFVIFFSLFTALFSLAYVILTIRLPYYFYPIAYSVCWFFTEYARSQLFTGFPWLLLGAGQIDSSLQYLLPVIGVFGVSSVTALASGFLGLAIHRHIPKKEIWLILLVITLILPLALKNKVWTVREEEALSVGIIQANLSMRDKWDSALYQRIQAYYHQTASTLMRDHQLIVMPESAIPMPTHYVSDFLNALHQESLENNSAVILGIPHANDRHPESYHNSILALGTAQGIYLKQHLVPFGEYVPSFLEPITNWLQLPNPSMIKGNAYQLPLSFNQYRIATLICYELAYPALLRSQLPQAAWIISLSDDGWFGHSFAIYQHMQMAQVLSKLTGRYQIVSNNDGLSSLINERGEIISNLPAYVAGTLSGSIYPCHGQTPWTRSGDTYVIFVNILLLCLGIGLSLAIAGKEKRSYPNKPS